MKFYLILTISLLMALSAHSQTIYFGFPVSAESLNKKDIIIINIPENTDGRFNKSKELDKLIEFINNDSDFCYKIEINIFYGSSKLNKDYSQSLNINLQKILKENSKRNNYELGFKGSENPIFLDKESPNYKLINTRIEILIE